MIWGCVRGSPAVPASIRCWAVEKLLSSSSQQHHLQRMSFFYLIMQSRTIISPPCPLPLPTSSLAPQHVKASCAIGAPYSAADDSLIRSMEILNARALEGLTLWKVPRIPSRPLLPSPPPLGP